MPGTRFSELARHLLRVVTAASLVGIIPTAVPAQQLNTLLHNMLQGVAPSEPRPPSYYPPPPAPYSYVSRPPSYTQRPASPPSYQQYPSYSRPPPVAPDGQAIAEMQRMLDDLGYDAGPADGAWGNRSGQALRAFQGEHGQVRAGVPTAAAERALRTAWLRRPPAAQTAAAVPAVAPSFSCAQPGNLAEAAICGTPDLAALDQQLAQAYSAARSAAGADASTDLLAQQRAWVRRRNACGADAACLRQSMTDRIAELQTVASPVASAAVDTQAGANPALPVQAAASQDTAPANDPLASLMHPPAGLRPWPLEKIDGHLVVPMSSRHPVASGQGLDDTGKSFFRLLADVSLPRGIEDENNTGFVQALLTDDAAHGVLGGPYGWAGNNNLEQADSRDAFRQRFAPLIRQMAPKLPLVLHWTETAWADDYDPARGGFQIRPFGSLQNGREQLDMVSAAQAAGFAITSGTSLPDLFWSVDRSTAETILRQTPDRLFKFVAVLELGAIDPEAKEMSLKLDQLALYSADLAHKLHDYEVAPVDKQARPGSVLADTGAPAATSADATQGAQRWHLPMLRGLPSIGGQSYDQFELAYYEVQSFGGDIGLNTITATKPLTSRELWTRAVLAMGLAQISDPATISDQAAVAISCTLLPRSEQVRLFTQPACGGALSSPTALFAMKDGAAAFRKQDLPRIQAIAPRLPFQFLLVIPPQVDGYDQARHGFPLRPPEQGALRVFGSPMDLSLPDFWPASEDDARRFLQTRTNGYGSQAWLGLKISVVGVVPGQPGNFDFNTGLPDHALWRFHTDQMALYGDAGLRNMLHDFTGAIPRLPPAILGSPEQTAPSRVASMPLTPEFALMALLHAGLPSGTTIDWAQAAMQRRQWEDTFRSRPDWRNYDPWGIFFPANTETVYGDAYRQWTLLRSANLPETLTISSLVAPFPFSGQVQPFTSRALGEVIGLGQLNGGGRTPGPGDHDLAAHGIDSSHLLNGSFYLAGNQHVFVDIAFPQSPDAYHFDTGSALADNAQTLPQATLVVTAKFTGVEVLAADQYGQRTIVLRLMPIAAHIRRGSTTLVSASLDGPEWKTATPQSTAEQRLAGPPYGPDVLGIRLGMKMSDAEALVRAALHVSRVSETQARPPRTGPAGPETAPNAMLHGRLFVDDSMHQAIALFEAPQAPSGRVLAVWRTVPVPVGAWSNLLPRMVAKYGPPARSGPREAAWTGLFIADCLPGPGTIDAEFDWLEGGQKTLGGVGENTIGKIPTAPVLINNFSSFKDCGPAVRIRSFASFMPNDPNEPLETTLFDLGVLSTILAGPTQPPKSAAGTAAVVPF